MKNTDEFVSGKSKSLDCYYQDELAYLRDMGQAFSEAYPKLAPFLERQGNDPDVERLLEGFSFIASRIRQRMDNSMSEFSQDINSVMWPQLQRPIPSFSIVKFLPPIENISTQKLIERNSEVSSVPVEGTRCIFSTCYDVSLYPVAIKEVELGERNGNAAIDISLHMDDSASLSDIKMGYLRFYIDAGTSSAKIYQYLVSQLTDIECQMSLGEEKCIFTLPNNSLKAVGFSADSFILPHPDNTVEAHQQLLEYYSFPEKYLFFDVCFDSVNQTKFEFDSLTISLGLKKKLVVSKRFNASIFQLYCTPVVNTINMDAEPIRLGDNKMEYLVKPANINQDHYSIFSIDSVLAIDNGGRSSRNLSQLYVAPQSHSSSISASYISGGVNAKDRSVNDLYQLRVRPSVTGDVDHFISFRADQHTSTSKSTISMQLTCTNRKLPEKLRQGDIKFTGENIPATIGVVNLHAPTKAIVAQIDDDTQWQMLSNFSAN
ncbi:MAG: type VI secretion system baseplate subunit TssF, partial [Thiohalomonadales bacterium]